MPKQIREFAQDYLSVLSQYKAENAWFFSSAAKTQKVVNLNDPDQVNHFLKMAFRVYTNVHSPKCREILLGDTAIRKQFENMLNFGLLSSTSNPQEEETRKLIDKAMGKRAAIAGRVTEQALKPSVRVNQTGGILNAEGWSPMMNDAMILAGVEKGLTFRYMLSPDEGKVYQAVAGGHRQVSPAFAQPVTRPNPGDAASVTRWEAERVTRGKLLWKKFFEFFPTAIWDGVPRMFARELLGLQHFGYRPILDQDELIFQPGPRTNNATMAQYLGCLRAVEFHRRNKQLIITAISNFLFQDATALAPLLR